MLRTTDFLHIYLPARVTARNTPLATGIFVLSAALIEGALRRRLLETFLSHLALSPLRVCLSYYPIFNEKLSMKKHRWRCYIPSSPVDCLEVLSRSITLPHGGASTSLSR